MSESVDRETSAAHPASGNDEVDAALERLAELDSRPATEHAEVYDGIQQRLADTLRRPDEG